MKKVGLMMAGMLLLTSVASASPLMDYSKGKAALDITYRFYQDMDASGSVHGLGYVLGSDPLQGSDKIGGKNDFEWGMTLGLGNDWAMQYRGFNAQAEKTYSICSDQGYPDAPQYRQETPYYSRSLTAIINPKVRSQEVNVLRKLDKNFSAFAGLVRITPSVKVTGNYAYSESGEMSRSIDSGYSEYGSASLTLGGEDKNTAQIGIIGSTKLADKTNLYGIASLGKDYRNWEAGVSYEVSKDLELNVSYRAAKYDNLKIANANWVTSNNLENPINAEVKSDVETKGWGLGLTYKF